VKDDIVPIHGQGFFTVSRRGEFYQIVRYDYYDPEGYYVKVLKSPTLYNEEISKLASNMQSFIDSEKVIVNGLQVKPKVLMVNIEHSGFEEYPHITFLIYFKGKLTNGINVFENVYEECVAEYDYEVYWVFPPRTKILEVEVSGDFDVVGNILYIWARRGDRIKGYEKIVFQFS